MVFARAFDQPEKLGSQEGQDHAQQEHQQGLLDGNLRLVAPPGGQHGKQEGHAGQIGDEHARRQDEAQPGNQQADHTINDDQATGVEHHLRQVIPHGRFIQYFWERGLELDLQDGQLFTQGKEDQQPIDQGNQKRQCGGGGVSLSFHGYLNFTQLDGSWLGICGAHHQTTSQNGD
jgi:hypothetical protein